MKIRLILKSFSGSCQSTSRTNAFKWYLTTGCSHIIESQERVRTTGKVSGVICTRESSRASRSTCLATSSSIWSKRPLRKQGSQKTRCIKSIASWPFATSSLNTEMTVSGLMLRRQTNACNSSDKWSKYWKRVRKLPSRAQSNCRSLKPALQVTQRPKRQAIGSGFQRVITCRSAASSWLLARSVAP